MFPNPQDALPLPRRPNVERYKNLAKDLVKACKSDDEDAIVDWAEQWMTALAKQCGVEFIRPLPVIVSRWTDQVTEFVQRKISEHDGRCRLADARFILARSRNFGTWARFSKHLNALQEKGSAIARFEIAADAIIKGDLKTLKRLLRNDPRLVQARSTRQHGATLLHYVSANGVEGYRQQSPSNSGEIAEMLIAAGADVNATTDVYEGKCTALGLVATSSPPAAAGVQREVIDVLLKHGARMDLRGSVGHDSLLVRGCLANGQPAAAEYLADRGAPLDLEGAAGLGRAADVTRLVAR